MGDWNHATQKIFDSMHIAANMTPGGVYYDQSGGLFTGGSLTMRHEARTTQLAHLDMPSLDMGCSGIDLFTGGMSFINAGELVNTLKTVAANSASYAFGLALQTVTPQIKAVLDIVHQQMMRINALTIQSCEKAAALVGGLWPKSDASKALYCSTKGLGVGRFDDWAHARQGCTQEGEQKQVEAQYDKRFAHMLNTAFNLVWDALKSSGLFLNERSWQEVFLSMTGTVIRDEHGKTIIYPALCHNEEWLLRIIGVQHGTIQAYGCANSQCTVMHVKEVTIQEPLYEKLTKFCETVCDKIRDGVPLSDEERALVQHSRVPVLKLLTVNLFSHEEVLPYQEIVEVMAFDVIIRWVERVIHLVDEAVAYIRSVQIDDTVFHLFTKNIRHTRSLLATFKQGFYHHLRSIISLVERSKLIEQRALDYGYHVLGSES